MRQMSEPEEVDVLTVKENVVYLTEEVRDEFKIKKGDKLVILNDNGKMVVKVRHKAKISDSS